MARQGMPEGLIEKLDFSREMTLPEIISDLSPAQYSSISRVSPSPSLGRLDALPPELVSQIFHFLDFTSLSRLSRVCLCVKAIVEELPAYKDMMEHAPEVLTALGETRIIHRHPAGLLRQALRSSRCLSCGAFGAFLFLPTCERACLACLEWNCGLRVTMRHVAKECFALTPAQAKQIPTMRSIPGRYGPVGPAGREDVKKEYRAAYRLVSVKDAKRFAIRTHGSADVVSRVLEERELWVSPRLFRLYRAMIGAPLGGSGRDALGRNARIEIEDPYYGMASIRFPFVTRTGVERGRVCRGCNFLLSLLYQNDLPEDVSVEDEGPAIYTGANRLLSDGEFWEHLGKCGGVQLLLERGEVTE